MSDADSLNAQIADAVKQLQAALPALAPAFGTAAAFQVLAHSLALRFQNSVAQQQHDHMLREALTAAASRALLDGRSAEAEAIIKLADSRLPAPDLAEELRRTKSALRELYEEFAKFTSPGPTKPARPKPARPPASPSAPRTRRKKKPPPPAAA